MINQEFILLIMEQEFELAQKIQFGCESWHIEFWLHDLHEIGQNTGMGTELNWYWLLQKPLDAQRGQKIEFESDVPHELLDTEQSEP